MPRRWNWDFEDGHGSAGRQGGAPGDPSLARRAALRRRRAGLGTVLAVMLLAIVIFSGSSHGGGASTTSAHAGAHLRGTGRAHVASAEEGGNSATRAVLAYTPFVKEGGGGGRDVALTFDDGPGPYTPGVLSVLERFHVRATFFAIGRMLRYFGASTTREVADGDVIGDHTENHPALALLTAHEQYEELFEGIARLELLGAPRPLLFRPPYGSFNATTMRQLHTLHLLMVLWSTDTNDYRQPGVSVIVERALAGAHPGAIILMHDAGGDRTQTIEALPAIIRGLRARGLHIVTVPQLLIDDPPPAGRPLPNSLIGD